MEFSSHDVTELASALLRVQARLKPVIKDRRNEFIGNNYATLLNIMDICKALLIEERIWLTQYNVEAEPGHLGLVTKLTHADSGQWQAGLSVVPLPKQDPQGYAIAQTYTRRYALSAMLGIVTAEDDQLDTDGEFLPTPASKPAPAPPRRQISDRKKRGFPITGSALFLSAGDRRRDFCRGHRPEHWQKTGLRLGQNRDQQGRTQKLRLPVEPGTPYLVA